MARTARDASIIPEAAEPATVAEVKEEWEEKPMEEMPPTTPEPTPEESETPPQPTAEEAETPPEPTAEETPVAEEPTPQPEERKLTDRLLPGFPQLQAFWDWTLSQVRRLLPQGLNEKLSDWVLTGAIAAILIALLWTTVALLPTNPSQVAKEPSKSVKAPPELETPEQPQPVAEAPSSEPSPPPQPNLTPEQSLVAAIQNQVAEITQQYGSGLIQSVEANFLQSRLIVKVSNEWYDLPESEQNALADEILSRSGELDFSKLEMTDLDGELLARSPVVGTNMVILKRRNLAANLPEQEGETSE